jgi:hypothetical protein
MITMTDDRTDRPAADLLGGAGPADPDTTR